MRRSFNREYHIRAQRQALRAAAAEAFYRPAQRVSPSTDSDSRPQKARRPKSRVSPNQLALNFSGPVDSVTDKPLFDLFPEAYQ